MIVFHSSIWSISSPHDNIKVIDLFTLLQLMKNALTTQKVYPTIHNQIYNLTSQLEASGASVDGEGANLYSEETIKSMLLATNAFRPAWQTQGS